VVPPFLHLQFPVVGVKVGTVRATLEVTLEKPAKKMAFQKDKLLLSTGHFQVSH